MSGWTSMWVVGRCPHKHHALGEECGVRAKRPTPGLREEKGKLAFEALPTAFRPSETAEPPDQVGVTSLTRDMVHSAMDLEGCPFPDDRLYDVDADIWVESATDGAPATLGILASLAAFAGRFTSVRFREIPDEVHEGQSLATLESQRFTGPVRLPVDGRLVARNDLLAARPKLLNDSPYDRGWVVRFIPKNPEALRHRLAPPEKARDLLRAKILALRIRCYPAVPDVEMYELGSECSAILAKLDDELARRAPEEVVLLVSDDPTSPIEMERWADRTGHTLLHHRVEGNLHHFLIRREATPVPRRRGPEGRLHPAGP